MHTVPAPVAPAPPPRSCADPTDGDAVAGLMARIAAGDGPAVWDLRETADVPVRSRVRAELRRLGVRYEAEDLDAMVVDAVLAIADVAGAWRPGGAPPWTWAHHRVVRAVHDFVGTFADSLDELGDGDAAEALGWLQAHAITSAAPAADAVTDPGAAIAATLAVLGRLAEEHDWAADLDAALAAVASPRDAAVWLAVLDERAAGNHRPAVTVGARFGMRPDAVRQASHRVWRRLDGAMADGRFAALGSLPAFAARRSA